MMASPGTHQVNTILRVLGPKARFTVFQIITCALGFVPAYLMLLGNVFIGRQVRHQCSEPPANTTHHALVPYQDVDNINITFDQCHITVWQNDTQLLNTKCLYGINYTSVVDRSFLSEFDLICDAAHFGPLSQTIMMAGQGLGASLATFISDRLGRKPVIVGSNIGLLASGLVVAFAPSYAVFAVGKFFSGAFQQGTVTSFYTYVVEMLVIEDRRLVPFIGGIIPPIVFIALDLLALALTHYSWRTLQLICSLTSLTALFQLWYQSESLQWLVANGKTDAIAAYIKRASKCNGKDYIRIKEELQLASSSNNGESTSATVKGEQQLEKFRATKKLSILDIFKTCKLARMTIIIWLMWIIVSMGYFTIYMTSVVLPGNHYVNFFLIAFMELLANGYTYLTFNRLGRRWSIFTNYVKLGGGLIAFAIFSSLDATPVTRNLALVSFCIGMMGASAAFGAVFTFTPELYPTNVRNQLTGLSSLAARLGAMVAPFMGMMSVTVAWGPGVLIGSLSLCVALLIPTLPETNGRTLPQTLDEMKSMVFNGNQGSHSLGQQKGNISSTNTPVA